MFMNLFYTIAKKSVGADLIGSEGRLRESLAAYFLTAAPVEQQTPKERKRYHHALKKMADLEIQTLLQSTQINRPLRYGDLTGLLTAQLEAAKRLVQEPNMQYKIPDAVVCTAAEPKLVAMSLLRLLRASLTANEQHPIKVNITIREQSIYVSVSSKKPPKDPVAMKLLHETAKLHKGSVIVSGGTVAFSLHRDLTDAIGIFEVPTINELMENPLSTVHLGLA